MKTIALIEKGSDGTFSVYTPHLESTIIGVGKDVTEAQSDFENFRPNSSSSLLNINMI